jgi:hypothetical protein
VSSAAGWMDGWTLDGWIWNAPRLLPILITHTLPGHPKSIRPSTVGDQIPADVRVTQLMSNILRIDQVGWMSGANASPKQ